MIQLSVCPSTLAEGFDTYSPSAQKMLFDGAKVSHILHVPSPASDTKEAKEAVENAGRISLSGVQPKFSIVVGSDSEEKSLAHNLIDHSFLSDDLKKLYKQSMSFRCQMLTF